MKPDEAAQVLGITAQATAEERRKALDTQRSKIEQKIAQAPTDGLKAKYREALKRLEEAYETLELAGDQSDLPSLKPDFAPGEIPKATDSIPSVATPAALSKPAKMTVSAAPPTKSSPVKWIVIALVTVVLLAVGIPYGLKKQREAEAQQKAAEAAKKEAERLANSRGGVIVKTKPTGATVALGVDTIEKSPATFKGVKIGKQTITITLEDYDTLRREVEVKENDFLDLGTLDLIRSSGILMISNAQADVEYELINVKREIENSKGKTPAELKSLPTGDYQLKLRRVGWPEFEQKVIIKQGKNLTVNYEFAEGELQINTRPEATNFELKQKSNLLSLQRGKSPGVFKTLPVGEYEVLVQRGGWADYRTNVVVSKGQSITLNREFPEGSLEISSQPVGLEYELKPLAGVLPVQTGKTPGEFKTLPEGQYQVRLTRSGWPEFKTNVNIQKEQKSLIANQFSESYLSWARNPSGAQVLIDGVKIDSAITNLVLCPGEHQVAAKYKDWPELQQKVVLESTKATVLKLEMPYGSIQLDSEPSGVSVKQNGRELGKTPLTLSEVPTGSVTFELQAQEFQTASVQGTVANGDLLKLKTTLLPLKGKIKIICQPGVAVKTGGDNTATGLLGLMAAAVVQVAKEQYSIRVDEKDVIPFGASTGERTETVETSIGEHKVEYYSRTTPDSMRVCGNWKVQVQPGKTTVLDIKPNGSEATIRVE